MATLNLIPDRSGYAIADSAMAWLSVDLSGGLPRTRRDLLGDIDATINVTWICDPLEFAILCAFHVANAARNYEAFQMWLFLDQAAPTLVNARFVAGTFRLASQSGETYYVSASVTSVPAEIDVHYGSVISLLQYQDANNTTIPFDAKGVVWTNTATGLCMVSTARYKFAGGSWYRNDTGNAGGLEHVFTGLAAGAYSWESFIYIQTAYPGTSGDLLNRFFNIAGATTGTTGSLTLYYRHPTGKLGISFNLTSGGGSYPDVEVGTMSVGAWHHTAITRDNSANTKFFLDGAQVHSVNGWASPAFVDGAVKYSPGRCVQGNGDYYKGNLAETRLTWGIDRSVGSTYPVPTAPLPVN